MCIVSQLFTSLSWLDSAEGENLHRGTINSNKVVLLQINDREHKKRCAGKKKKTGRKWFNWNLTVSLDTSKALSGSRVQSAFGSVCMDSAQNNVYTCVWDLFISNKIWYDNHNVINTKSHISNYTLVLRIISFQ